MTAEREAMTLERVRDELRKIADACPAAATKIDVALRLRRMEHMQAKLRVIADAIDAHLSRAAEPVGYVFISDLERLSHGELHGEIFRCPAIGATDGRPDETTPVYTHPSEDARDAGPNQDQTIACLELAIEKMHEVNKAYERMFASQMDYTTRYKWIIRNPFDFEKIIKEWGASAEGYGGLEEKLTAAMAKESGNGQ